MVEGAHSSIRFPTASPAETATAVTTAKNLRAWLGTTEGRGRNIDGAANVNGVATSRSGFVHLYIALDRGQVRHLVASKHLFAMATWQRHIRNLEHARSTLLAAELRTLVPAIRPDSRTGLAACQTVVHH